VDDCCCTDNFVAVGVGEQLYDGRVCSCPAGGCHYHCAGQSHSGARNIVAIWTLAGEDEVFGKEGGKSMSGKILPKLFIPSVEKVS
jgi:hypothetical protein